MLIVLRISHLIFEISENCEPTKNCEPTALAAGLEVVVVQDHLLRPMKCTLRENGKVLERVVLFASPRLQKPRLAPTAD